MYGWKARVGLMIPSPNVTLEPEFNTVKPDGISVQFTRLLREGDTTTEHNLSQMAEDTEPAAKLLATADWKTGDKR